MNVVTTSARLMYLLLPYFAVAVVCAVMPPEFPPITVEPAAVIVARPAPFGPFAMVATLATDELQ